MLRDCIMEESFSPCSSPIVAASKPDRSFHICNDFWKLNQVAEFECYSLLRVDDLID